MHQAKQEVAMKLTLLLLAACGAEDTNPQGGPVDEFQSTLAELEAKTTEHYDAVVGTTDTDAIEDEETAFWDLCQGLRDDVGTCWDRMNECDSGHGMNGMMGGEKDEWQTWMHDMWASMGDHHGAMGHCSDAVKCHDTETAWHETMSEMFDQMHGMDHDWPEDCNW